MSRDPMTAQPGCVRVALYRHLTSREERVVQLVAAGLTNRRIAGELAISVRTVMAHVENAAAKIPGSLPPRTKITCWWRGAGRDTLGG